MEFLAVLQRGNIIFLTEQTGKIKHILPAGQHRVPCADASKVVRAEQPDWEGLSVPELIEALEKEMLSAAENLEYERAAQLRAQLRALEKNE